MKAISRAISMTLTAGILAVAFAAKASAGCGEVNLQGPFLFEQPNAALRGSVSSPQAEKSSANGLGTASIVGMWKIHYVSLGNTTHNPSIPDGALIDFGYSQWHSDGTEILNSGGHAPATGNFCLGVWGQTGFGTFVLNHFPISYNLTTGVLTNYINLREQVTLSPSGDSFTGTFTILIYDTNGNEVDHLAGTVNATRITVDSTLPTAAAGN